jgi:selenocysteine-specific elongation factor
VLGFVDVPGHEKFIRNMLAGATGIDFVLLVVAATTHDAADPRHLAIVTCSESARCRRPDQGRSRR